ALPAGHLSRRFVTLFVVGASLLLIFAAGRLNRLALYLSPVALAIVLLYSYTKRFTRWSHLVLGLALGLAPAAAWIAIRGQLDPRILVLTAAVTFWVGGFDIIYSCQDYEFDRREGLHSVPRFFGIGNALWIARVLHLLMMGLLAWLALLFHLGMVAGAGIVVVGLLLAYEHSLVSADDLSKLNAAFFTTNGVVSVVFFLFVAADVLLRR
ncbi:MAG TPA: UbiA-like polyprenyltransferase, partial [Terriglobales bacterium]|nr:UbiA-like polyprenyltransferase [Terriglobales bacterium]